VYRDGIKMSFLVSSQIKKDLVSSSVLICLIKKDLSDVIISSAEMINGTAAINT
jgi:hypothetical protein